MRLRPPVLEYCSTCGYADRSVPRGCPMRRAPRGPEAFAPQDRRSKLCDARADRFGRLGSNGTRLAATMPLAVAMGL